MRIPMPFERWEQIPRHPDWKYEYFDDAAVLSYRPKPLHLRRATATPVPVGRPHDVRLIDATDTSAREFLAVFWRDEDPYRTVDDPDEWLRDDLKRSFGRLAEPGGAIVEEDGTIIGAVLVERPHRDETEPYLSCLSVRHGFRCDGVGTAMLAAITAALHRAGVEHLDSGASVGNRASVAWHWRNGFEALPDPYAAFLWGARRR